MEMTCVFTHGIPGLGVLPGGDAKRDWPCAEVSTTGSKGPYTFELVSGQGDKNNTDFSIGTMINDNAVNILTQAPWGPGDPQESDRPLTIRVQCTDTRGKKWTQKLTLLD